MANRHKYPVPRLRGSDYETAGEGERMLGEPKRVVLDTGSTRGNVFQKTDREKAMLKIAKAECKREAMKR